MARIAVRPADLSEMEASGAAALKAGEVDAALVVDKGMATIADLPTGGAQKAISPTT